MEINKINFLINGIIPPSIYSPLFYNIMLFLVLALLIKLIIYDSQKYNFKKKDYATSVLLIFIILYMGLRPISGYFGDMITYNNSFERYQNGREVGTNKDIYWNVFMKFCSSIMSAQMFFLTCSTLYILPLYFACKNWFKKSKYIPFLMLIISFSFWAYGTNGIRNGIATSFILYGFSLKGKSIKRYMVFILAILTHISAIIPVAAYILTVFFKKSKSYLYGWLLSIPLSLLLGNFWQQLFASFGFEDKRINYLIESNVNNDDFAYTGFRWDFVIYSASAIYVGYYFIIKHKFNDKVYQQLFNIYVTVNAFWILIIRANFSNRFAYLSWFMIAIIIFYPFFKSNFIVKQHKRLASIIFLYFCFTYFMTF